MHCVVSMYLSKRKLFFFSAFCLLSSKHGVPSLPCIVGALSDVFFFFFNMTEYQFVLGTPVSSRVQWCCISKQQALSRRHPEPHARWYHISLKVGKWKMNGRLHFSDSIFSRPALCAVWRWGWSLEGSQDLCRAGQGSWKQRASVAAAYVGGAQTANQRTGSLCWMAPSIPMGMADVPQLISEFGCVCVFCWGAGIGRNAEKTPLAQPRWPLMASELFVVCCLPRM